MKALVTGGAGFIGSHLVEELIRQGNTVTVLDNLSTGRLNNLKGLEGSPDFKFVQADVSDPAQITAHFAGIDCVFHLAALADVVPSIVEPYKYHRANVDGTVSVLEACRLNNVKKLVYTASSSCYGIPDKYPTSEDCPASPQYPYAFTKYAGEQYALAWARIYKLNVVSLRLFNVYGPRSRTSGTYGAVIGVFLKQKLSGAPFTIVGDGEQTRDFIYVSDVAKAFIAAAKWQGTQGVFNVGSGKPQSVNKLAGLLGAKEIIHIPKRPGEPDCTWADITRIRDILGWAPSITFEEGVARVLENIDYWKDAPLWTPDKIGEATRDWFKYLSK